MLCSKRALEIRTSVLNMDISSNSFASKSRCFHTKLSAFVMLVTYNAHLLEHAKNIYKAMIRWHRVPEEVRLEKGVSKPHQTQIRSAYL